MPGHASIAALALAGLLAGATSRPTLRFASIQPTVVGGTAFPAGMRLRVVVTSGESQWTRRVVVSRMHTFSVSFGTLPVSRCSVFAAAFGGRLHVSTKPAETGCPEPVGP